MNSLRRVIAIGLTLSVLLQACGGGGDSTGNGSVRLINATLSHPSLDLLVNAAVVVPATAQQSASAYVAPAAGSLTLQVNDAGSSTSLALASAVIVKDYHYSVLAYESGGAVRLAVISEDIAAPAAGSAQMHVFDAAGSAGALDVYVTDAATDLAAVSSPSFSVNATSFAQSSGLVTFAPGTYRVRVTGAGNKADLRLDMASVTLADQQVGTVLLTPTAGAGLVNGGWLLQQSTFTANRNTSARVRLAAAVSGGASVAASAGGTSIAGAAAAPSIGAYTVVPAAGALAVTVNGTAVNTAALSFAEGTDVTLLVYGSPTAATATAIVDDNFLPATSTNLKMRLLNGVTGNAVALTLLADFAVVANAIAPGQASPATLVAGNSTMRVEVTSAASQQSLFLQTALNIPGGGVYTLFMLGDAAAPVGVLRKDR
jgi:hypothetical protein